MFAIVEIAGLQYKVEQDQKLFVNRLKGDKGGKVSFDKVLLTVNGNHCRRPSCKRNHCRSRDP
jgi:large subunit ribosomal protein L21